MIAWPIKAALETNLFDRVIVSTDDLEIAEIAAKFGAEVPFIRPIELADDYSSTMVVVKHAIETLVAKDISVDEVCCIYATDQPLYFENVIKSLED